MGKKGNEMLRTQSLQKLKSRREEFKGIEMEGQTEFNQPQPAWLARLEWGEEIQLLRSNNEMVAVAGSENLQVFYISSTDQGEANFKSLAKFNLGTSTIALSWSPTSFSPTFNQEANEWQFKIELVVATKNGAIRTLSSSSDGNHQDLQLSFSQSRVNDLAWSEAEGSGNLIAIACENGTLQIFDLDSPDENQVPSNFVLSFANPLVSTSFHHSLASLLLVSDSKGISRLINYQDSKDHNSIRTLITFKDPKSLSNSSTLTCQPRNRVEWKRSDSNLLASFNDGDWKVWDLRRLSGGNPCLSGRIYERGTLGGLRWSTNPSLLAIFVTSTKPNASQSVSTSISSSHPISILDSYSDSPRRISRSSLLGLGSSSEIRGPNIKDVGWLDTSPLKDEDVLIIAVGKEVILVSASSARAD